MELIDDNPEIKDGRPRKVNRNVLVALKINGKRELHYIHEDTLASLQVKKVVETLQPEVVAEKELPFIVEEEVAVIEEEKPIVEEKPVEEKSTFKEKYFGKKKDKKKK